MAEFLDFSSSGLFKKIIPIRPKTAILLLQVIL